MSSGEQEDPLIEWNRLNKENAEQAIVSSIYQNLAGTTSKIDKFSTWLLAGTGATSALLITQIASILPYLTTKGFKICLMMLVISAILGFVAKYKSLRCEIQLHVQTEAQKSMDPILKKHGEDEDRIVQYAKQRGIQLQTDVEISNVIAEFVRPFPFWMKWLVKRQTSRIGNDRQAGYHVAILAYLSQIRWTLSQAIFFVAFIISAAWYASAI